MKTAVAQMIEKVEDECLARYSYEDVLEMLQDAQITQDAQIKLAYTHGQLSILQESGIGFDEYFTKEFKQSL